MEKIISIPGNIVKFYPYRTARLIGWSCYVILNKHDDYQYLRRKLQKAGYDMDNHIVFCTENCNFWWSDNHLYIGGEIVEGEY